MKSQTENIMKQFNLEEYLKNPSKKVVTRDGRSARIICTDFNNPIYPVIGEIKGAKWPISFTASGRQDAVGESPIDLFFASKRHEGWLNIYKAGVQRETLGYLQTRYAGSSIWPTEEAAMTAADPDPVATIKIEWEE